MASAEAELLEEIETRNVQIARSDKPDDAPAAFSATDDVIEAKIGI